MKLLFENWRGYLKEEKSYQILDGEDFQKQYITSEGENLSKAAFGDEDEEAIVSDISHYGDGDYWCVTDNCEEHYSENPNYLGVSYEKIPTHLKIAVGSQDAYYDNQKEIRAQADGFYDPEFDTYGLVLFQRLGEEL